LVDYSIIYSAGVESVVFKPKIQEKQVKAVEFSNILHISDSRENIFSCLYLTCEKGFEINIFLHVIIFKRNSKPFFTVLINFNNSAIFNSDIFASESSLSMYTLPNNIFL